MREVAQLLSVGGAQCVCVCVWGGGGGVREGGREACPWAALPQVRRAASPPTGPAAAAAEEEGRNEVVAGTAAAGWLGCGSAGCHHRVVGAVRVAVAAGDEHRHPDVRCLHRR